MDPERIDRLHRGRDITAVLRGRHQRAGELAAVHVRPGSPDAPERGPAKVAVIASKRVGDAVTRNRCKRVLREAARHVAWMPGTEVVLVARAACAGHGLAEVHDEVTRLAARLGVTRDAA